ncbi:Hypothetical protein, putative [Bodo saltans]|uniref:Uncharacterized protein n=1 Tax=Bodo saltans TaxID=75058 RepID=A0A0S4J576_BODSA|nr:Hypothetical protein, putative [Bodo saltans]|eukprot:CUG84368.1 Hypothetical protein, putative [Bodo saltans]
MPSDDLMPTTKTHSQAVCRVAAQNPSLMHPAFLDFEPQLIVPTPPFANVGFLVPIEVVHLGGSPSSLYPLASIMNQCIRHAYASVPCDPPRVAYCRKPRDRMMHGTATLVVEFRCAVNSLGRAVDDFCQRLSHRFLMDQQGMWSDPDRRFLQLLTHDGELSGCAIKPLVLSSRSTMPVGMDVPKSQG